MKGEFLNIIKIFKRLYTPWQAPKPLLPEQYVREMKGHCEEVLNGIKTDAKKIADDIRSSKPLQEGCPPPQRGLMGIIIKFGGVEVKHWM